jgi:tetratricopeptide (TPR) repeat protein
MGKTSLIIELFLRSILPPFYSFSLIESVCKKKLEIKPNDKDVLWVLSNVYVNYKEYEKAKKTLESMHKIGKGTRSVRLLLSRVYYNLGQYEKVKNVLIDKDVLLSKDKENYYIGDSLLEMKQYEASAKYLAQYTSYNQNEYVPFVKLGYAYYMQGFFDLALNAYIKAKKIEPENRKIEESIELCRKKIGGT